MRAPEVASKTPYVLTGMICLVVGGMAIHQLPLLWFQDSVHYLSLGEHLARGEMHVEGAAVVRTECELHARATHPMQHREGRLPGWRSLSAGYEDDAPALRPSVRCRHEHVWAIRLIGGRIVSRVSYLFKSSDRTLAHANDLAQVGT